MRERLIDQKQQDQANKKNGNLKTFLSKSGTTDATFLAKPMADLFLETTVMFADISGFTAWSSVREPTQVFILLENIYGAFDKIAKKRAIYKVETVGDCYVSINYLLQGFLIVFRNMTNINRLGSIGCCCRAAGAEGRPCDRYGKICSGRSGQDELTNQRPGSRAWT